MNVRELIDILSRCNPDALVLISRYGGPPESPHVREARGLPHDTGYGYWIEDSDCSVEQEKQNRLDGDEKVGEEIIAVVLE